MLRSHPTVILTDLDNVCPLLERNVARAFSGGTTGGRKGPQWADVRVLPLPWGEDKQADDVLAACPSPPTHILCSDLVYFPELLPLLLRSLIRLTSDAQHAPAVVLAYRVRSLEKEQPFFQALGAWFDFAPVLARRRTSSQQQQQQQQPNVHHSRADAWHRFCSLASDLDARKADEPPEDDYFVFVAHRRGDSYDYTPPRDDAKLMGGWRDWDGGRAWAEEGQEQEQEQGAAAGPSPRRSAPAAGDTFELLLLGDLGDLADG